MSSLEESNRELVIEHLDTKTNKVETIEESSQSKDVDYVSLFLNPTIKKGEINHWSADSVKIGNLNWEQDNSASKYKETGFSNNEALSEKYISVIDECACSSTTGNISFRFFFMEGRNFLKIFHLQMFVILKKFIEKLIHGHRQISDSKYVVDIFVFVTPMKENELGSAMIHKYVRNDDTNLILPTKAIMKINKRYLSNSVKDKVNIKLMQTLFHELFHCLGFGYWELFNKNFAESIISSNGLNALNVLNNENTLNNYKNIFRTNHFIGVPMNSEKTHFNTFNVPILKNGKLFGVLPGLKHEIMSNNDSDLNVFTKVSASILEELGYNVNYNLCDEYPFSPLPDELSVEYTKATNNHFANKLEKYIMLLKNGKVMLSGIETFSMKQNREYTIKNRHSYSLYVVSALEENEEYLLREEEGVTYKDNELVIRPNTKTPNLFYIVSSITFGGIPIVKEPDLLNVNNVNCYNKNSLRRLMEDFMEGKIPRF